MKKINNSTYQIDLIRDKIEIGDKSALNFKPAVKLFKWEEECFLKISLKTINKNFNPLEKDNSINFVDKDKKIKIYKLEETKKTFKTDIGYHKTEDRFEEGGLEFEIDLLKKPNSNKVLFNIETKGLDFYYQPELTKEEKEGGCWRPEDVIGAYAIYHKDQQKILKTQEESDKYKCGIFGMLYRPKIFDSAGKEVWGKLNIDVENKLLTVEIPQEFLDNAVYPVKHAAGLTFGYETIGSSSDGFSNCFYGSDATPTSNGMVGSMKVYLEATYYSQNYGLCIYKDSDNSRIGYTLEGNSPTVASEWQELNITSGGTIVASTKYWLLAWTAGNTHAWVKYNTVTDRGLLKSYTYDYPNFPATLSSPTKDVDKLYSIYAIYTSTEDNAVMFGCSF